MIEIAVVLALVAIVFAGFIRERPSPDIVALGAVAILLAVGILDAGDVLAVFGNSAPVTVAAMFVLGAALERTGVVDQMARLVARAGRRSPLQALLVVMAAAMTMSAFINNTPVVIILTPAVISLAATVGVSPSKFLIPLSFATIFGGTTTLIGTSTNIIVDGVAQKMGLAPFGMFEITGAGLALAAIGIGYMVLVGRHILPDRDTLASLLPRARDRNFLAEVLVPLDSPLVGKPLKAAGFTEERGLHVIDVIRQDVSLRRELDSLTIAPGDRLVVRSKMRDMLGLRAAEDVMFGGPDGDGHAIEPIAARETTIMEGIVGPRSRFAGRRVGDLALRRLYGAYILAIHRQGESLGQNFDQVRLRLGDTLLLEGSAQSMKLLFDDQALVNLTAPEDRPLRRGKAPIAIAAVVLVMLLATFEVMPIAGLALIAAIAVIAFGCLEPDEAYASVRWNILMLIFGMLALGTAMEKTGAAIFVVEHVAAVLGGLGPLAVLSAVYLLTSILTEMMSNNATAILLTPIAVGLAQQLGVDPRPFAVAVMFAASASFATPIGYQTNTFVYNAGGYRFMDFVRVGVPLNLVLWVAATFIIPLFWPLG